MRLGGELQVVPPFRVNQVSVFRNVSDLRRSTVLRCAWKHVGKRKRGASSGPTIDPLILVAELMLPLEESADARDRRIWGPMSALEESSGPDSTDLG